MTTEPPESAAERAPSSPRKTTKKPFFGKGLLLVALLLAAAVAAVIYVPVVQSWIPAWIPGIDLIMGDEGTTDTSVEEELSALDSALSSFAQRLETQEQRFSNLAEEVLTHGTALAALEERISALETRAGIQMPSSASASGNIAGRLEMLAARLSQLESAFVPLREKAQAAIDATDALRDDLAAQDRLVVAVTGLEDRLANLEQSAAADKRGAIIAIAFSTLRDVAGRGRPFSMEYETLHGLLSDGNRDALAGGLRAIAPYAASGAPTLAMLRASFADNIPMILEAARTPVDASWWRRFMAKLSTIVTVRQTGELSGPDSEAILARLERRLAGNDLAGALREFAALPTAAQTAADPRAADARKRAALDEALTSFAATLLRDVASVPAQKD